MDDMGEGLDLWRGETGERFSKTLHISGHRSTGARHGRERGKREGGRTVVGFEGKAREGERGRERERRRRGKGVHHGSPRDDDARARGRDWDVRRGGRRGPVSAEGRHVELRRTSERGPTLEKGGKRGRFSSHPGSHPAAAGHRSRPGRRLEQKRSVVASSRARRQWPSR